MRELDELKNELDALTTEHQALGLRCAELKKAEEAAPRGWNHLGHRVGSAEFYEAERQRMDAEMHQDRVESRMAWLSRRIMYLEQLAGADKEIAKAQKEEQAAAERVARIEQSLSRVFGQLEALRADQGKTEEQRQHAEQEVAQALAAATAGGDSKALEAARAQMDSLTAEGRSTRAKQEANAPVITALGAEEEALQQQLATARKEQQKAASAVNAAQRLKKGAEWDQAVSVLTEIGTDLVALGVGYPLTHLKVPTFAPGAGGDVTLHSLQMQHKQAAA
ncbi:MAG: hypothetical protein AB7E40_08345 [Pseudomonas sp.]